MFRKAFVTGASSGLGKALCVFLAKKKIPLILSARDETKLSSLQKKLDVETEIITAHLENRFDQEKLASALYKHQPDLIINNAGFGLYGETTSVDLHEQLDLVEVNAIALMHLSIAGAKMLKESGRKGIILNISSAAAYFPFPYLAAYAASKGFVNQFSIAMDHELSPFGIRVLTACPGQIDTPFRHRAAKKNVPKEMFSMRPEKVAEIIWKQLLKKKQVQVMDSRYQFMVFLTKIISKDFLMNLLKKRMRKRL